MARPSKPERAKRLHRFALFALFALAFAAVPAAARECPADRIDESVRVRFVNDGDTLTLSDGRRVRLIGINAPEIAHDDRPGEPGGIEARNSLRRLVRESGQRIGLRFDEERRDRHGRWLAHVFDRKGRNLAALLVERGEAFAVTIPPNLWQSRCLHALEQTARRNRRGVWGMPFWKPVDLDRAQERKRLRTGFRLLRGRVLDSVRLKPGTRVRLSGGVTLWIPARDRRYFGRNGMGDWKGRRLEARGWMYLRRGKWQMTLTHPLNVTRLPATEMSDSGPQCLPDSARAASAFNSRKRAMSASNVSRIRSCSARLASMNSR